MRVLIVALLALFTCSCVTKTETVIKYVEGKTEVHSPTPQKKDRIFRVYCILNRNGEYIQTPIMAVVEGEMTTLKACSEVFLPDYWKAPKITKKGKLTSFQLPGPIFSQSTDIGLTIKLTAQKVETLTSENKIHLQGTISYSEMQLENKVDQQPHDILPNYFAGYSKDVALFSVFVNSSAPTRYTLTIAESTYSILFTAHEIIRNKQS